MRWLEFIRTIHNGIVLIPQVSSGSLERHWITGLVRLLNLNGVERLLGCFNVSIDVVLDQREGQSIVITLNNALWRSCLSGIGYLEGKQSYKLPQIRSSP